MGTPKLRHVSNCFRICDWWKVEPGFKLKFVSSGNSVFNVLLYCLCNRRPLLSESKYYRFMQKNISVNCTTLRSTHSVAAEELASGYECHPPLPLLQMGAVGQGRLAEVSTDSGIEVFYIIRWAIPPGPWAVLLQNECPWQLLWPRLDLGRLEPCYTWNLAHL